MTTDGMEGLLIETHNFGKTVAFWKALGYSSRSKRITIPGSAATLWR